MKSELAKFVLEHTALTRRYFLGCGVAGMAAVGSLLLADDRTRDPKLQQSLDALESWLTHPDEFRDVSRGNPLPHSLSEDRRKEVGLTRETWKLDVQKVDD